MKVAWFRFLDFLQSRMNQAGKEILHKRKLGPRWRDYVRPGRRYTRVIAIPPSAPAEELRYAIRETPGWEWYCPQCHTYSLISEGDMPEVLNDWAKLCENAIKQGFKVPVKPTMATAGCTNCKFRPGEPE
jgi:hypothetical protein